SVYQEWGTGDAEYNRDRVFYEMNCDAETGSLITRCGFNCDPEYNPFYCFFAMSEEEFSDNEQHEHYTEISHENGVIRMVSRFDETLSREQIEDIWGLEYNGQYIRTEAVINEDNYEFISNSLIMVEDGKDVFSFVTSVEYDVPEPAASRNLRAAYERESENMVNITCVADPGTDHEISRKLTVPVNSDVSIDAGDTPFVYFNDPDCETLKHWDRMSDVSFYIFTDPDKALTEKYEKLRAKLSGQDLSGRQDIPFDSKEFEQLDKEVYEANLLDELFKHHKSVVYEYTELPDNDLGWLDYFYMTKDVCYHENAETAEYDYDRYFYFLEGDGSGNAPEFGYGVDLTSDYDLLADYGYQLVPDLEPGESWFNSETEEHVECYIEDGRIYMKDRCKEESAEEWFKDNVPNETYDGGIIYNEVIADAKTKEILEFNTYLEKPDGTMRLLLGKKASYDAEEPRRVRNMRAVAERYCENMIDVTFTVDPGTDHELSKSITMPVGSTIKFYCDNGDKAIYFDNAEATELTHWDGMKSKSLYIFTDPTEEQIKTREKLLKKVKQDHP
nr:hypothetical protein [Lachnospiraceae bacterium]